MKRIALPTLALLCLGLAAHAEELEAGLRWGVGAFEATSLFAPADVLYADGSKVDPAQHSTGSLTTIGLAFGFDAF